MSMRIIFLSSVLLSVLFMATSCEKDVSLAPAWLEVKFQASMNGAPFQLNEPFIGPNGHRIAVEDLRFYVSNFTLTGTSGKQASIETALINFTDQQSKFYMQIPAGTYQNLQFNVGVPPAMNGIGIPEFDPAKYPPGHPLNISNGMYWTSMTGYVFLVIQGKMDTSATKDKPLLFPWFYHVGLNELYGLCSYNNLTVRANTTDTMKLNLHFEINDLFISPDDTIQMPEENFTHTTDHFNLAASVIRNFRHAIHVQ
jgi:hypothetical protein